MYCFVFIWYINKEQLLKGLCIQMCDYCSMWFINVKVLKGCILVMSYHSKRCLSRDFVCTAILKLFSGNKVVNTIANSYTSGVSGLTVWFKRQVLHVCKS